MKRETEFTSVTFIFSLTLWIQNTHHHRVHSKEQKSLISWVCWNNWHALYVRTILYSGLVLLSSSNHFDYHYYCVLLLLLPLEAIIKNQTIYSMRLEWTRACVCAFFLHSGGFKCINECRMFPENSVYLILSLSLSSFFFFSFSLHASILWLPSSSAAIAIM